MKRIRRWFRQTKCWFHTRHRGYTIKSEERYELMDEVRYYWSECPTCGKTMYVAYKIPGPELRRLEHYNAEARSVLSKAMARP